jgi:hypothetical protein
MLLMMMMLLQLHAADDDDVQFLLMLMMRKTSMTYRYDRQVFPMLMMMSPPLDDVLSPVSCY